MTARLLGPDETSGGPASRRARLFPWLRAAVAVVVLAAMLGFVSAHWDEIRRQTVAVDWAWLAGASVVLVGGFAVVAIWWGSFVRRMGVGLSVAQGAVVWLRSVPTKYVPGGVGLILHRMVWSHQQTLSPERLAVLLLFEQGYPLLGAALLGGAALILSGHLTMLGQFLTVLIVLIPVAIAVLWPAPLVRVLSAVRRLMGQPPVAPPRVTAADIGRAIASFLLHWLLIGAAFYGFLRAMQPAPALEPPFLFSVAAYSMSFVAGFVVVIAPNGLGIREACLAWFLSQLYDMPIAVWIGLMSRVWIMALEGLCAGAVMLWRQPGTPRAAAEGNA